jgi:hypothetical protein
VLILVTPFWVAGAAESMVGGRSQGFLAHEIGIVGVLEDILPQARAFGVMFFV